MRSLSSLARYDIFLSCHGLTVLTGQAAAYKLGADYPSELYTNAFAKLSFSLYLLLAHGLRLKESRTSHNV